MQYTSYQNVKDAALWNLVLKGDMKALSFLYKKHYELLLNFGLKYTSDEEFVTSLKNVISDKLSSLRLTEDLNEHFFELKIEDTALESLFKGNDEELQLSKKLIDAYKSLPENQRVAIYLRYVKGLSYKEMAAVLNINPQSSMNLVSRALTSLRSKMTLDEYLLFIILFFS